MKTLTWCLHVVGCLLVSLHAGSVRAQGPLGNALGDRPVLVITSSYADTVTNLPPPLTVPPTPPIAVITDVVWAATLQAQIRPYYAAATGGRAGFSFVASSTLGPGMPATVALPYTEASTAPGGSQSSIPAGGLGTFSASNDPEVLSRDARRVLDAIDAAAPGQLGNTFKHVLVMHRAAGKRGRAASPFPYQALLPGGGGLRRPVTVYVALIGVPPNQAMQHDTLRTVGHELGHQLGLPDLYNEMGPYGSGPAVPAGYPTHEFTENWDEMGLQRMQNFSTFSRNLAGWLAPDNLRSMPVGLTPVDEVVDLSPPLRGTAARPFEAIRLMYSPLSAALPPQYRPSYLIESRAGGAPASLDDARTGPLLPGQTPPPPPPPPPPMEQGLPPAFQRGVLISHSKPWLPAANFAPLHPLEVRPSVTRAAGARPQLDQAVYTTAPGRNVFFDASNGVTVDVLALHPDGGARVRVRVRPPPRPDVVATHCWLDSPGNGMGSFLTPVGPLGDPEGFGDPLLRSVIVTWDHHPPWPDRPVGLRVVTPDHRLSCRVHNQGNAPAKGVTAELFLVTPSLLVVGAPITAAVIQGLNPFQSFTLNFGDMPAGATAVRSVTVTPDGPFLAGLVLKPASVDLTLAPDGRDELNLLDNARLDSFVVVQVAPGSPYAPLDMELPVFNASGTPRVVYTSVGAAASPQSPNLLPSLLPIGWTGDLQRTDAEPFFAALDRGKQARYRLRLQPADPSVDKPGVQRPLDLLAWMDDGDSWVPAQALRVSVLLSHQTQLSLVGKRLSATQVELSGQLRWLDLAHAAKPVARAPLVVSIDCSNGTRRQWMPGQPGHTARSDARGNFRQLVQVPATAQCLAHADYAGSIDHAASRAPALAIQAAQSGRQFLPWPPRPAGPR